MAKTPDGKKYPDFMGQFVVYLPWLGGTVCCLLLLLFWLASGDDKSDVGRDIDQIEKAETVTAVLETNVQLPERKEEAEKTHPPEEKVAPVQAPEKNAPADKAVVVPVEKSSQQDIDQVQRVVEQIAVGIAEKVESGAADEGVAKVVVEAKEMQAPKEVANREVESIALLRLTRDLKKKKSDSPSKPRQGVNKLQPRTEAQNVIVSSGNFAVDQLYDERLLAGVGWKGREKENMYTVQLMALASITAEKNLKKMLAQVNYRQEAGNFYIFKKATVPENIFVFYGEYPSIERARLAKNSLPKFLRDHRPYALSIKGAIAKARK